MSISLYTMITGFCTLYSTNTHFLHLVELRYQPSGFIIVITGYNRCTLTPRPLNIHVCVGRTWVGGWVNQAYSRLSTTHGHITDCKLDSVVYASVCVWVKGEHGILCTTYSKGIKKWLPYCNFLDLNYEFWRQRYRNSTRKYERHIEQRWIKRGTTWNFTVA